MEAAFPPRFWGFYADDLMKKSAHLVFCLLVLTLVFAGSVWAAQKNVVILPFSTEVPKSMTYLGKAVPSAVQSKLSQSQAVSSRLGQSSAHSVKEARAVLGGADYAIWGKVAVQGNTATITMNSVDRSGKIWSKTQQTPLNAMTPAIHQMTQAMTSEAMGLSMPLASGGMMTPGSNALHSPARGAASNSDIIVNETNAKQQQYYLNPQFRYQGASASDSTRLRSQRLKHSMSDMAVADFNGDGKNEVAIVDAHHLHIYVWGNDGR
ncbi:MAG: VCBS repeat-containing protein, partial [Desulfovibrio sp.]|nr:VCBS repeat-containing protein [Desulfovibrio sp.]